MNYTKDMKKAVAGQIAAMLINDVLGENGYEPFEGWCENGEAFATEDGSENGDFVNGCTALMQELAPMVDAIHERLTDSEN